jgi:uncharacterized protein YbbK (DUF523 family)
MPKMIIVSSCLIGINCRYNGTNSKIEAIEKMVVAGKAMPLCPEVLGGLDIPRPCCEIAVNNDSTKSVVNENGEDFTLFFKKGAKKTLEIAKILKVETAILKAKSPSCGYGKIYDGTFRGKLKEGNGLTADLLSKNNINIYNEDNFKEK